MFVRLFPRACVPTGLANSARTTRPCPRTQVAPSSLHIPSWRACRPRRAVSSPRRNLRLPLQPPSASASACVLSNSSHNLHARRAQRDVVRDVSAAVAVARACRIDGTAGRSVCDTGAHDGPARRRYDRPAAVCIPSPLCRAHAYEHPVGYDAPPDDLGYPDLQLTRRRRSSRMCAGGHLYMRSGGSSLTTPPPPPPTAPSRCMRAFTSLALEQNHCGNHVGVSFYA
jgi:hypothetical protein